MAATKTSKSTIDNLPEVQRRKVVDAILAGKSLRQVAKMVGISAVSVKVYKDKVVMPAIRTAQKVQAFQSLPSTNSELIKEQTAITRDIIQASPFKQRLEKLWDRTEKALDRAETAVRVVKDEDTGQLVSVGPDVAAIGPLLNQAHKNVELLGRVTGELEVSAGSNIAIQIVLPQAGSGAADESPSAYRTIDIALPKR